MNQAARRAHPPGARGRSFERNAMRLVNIVTLVLLIVGGLNWGLVGLFGFDLVAAIFGEMSALSRIVYTLVGASALWQIIPLVRGDEAQRARA
jgi:uncharacterized protein